MVWRILVTDEFDEWLLDEPARSRVQIAKRLENIKEAGHFGDYKRVRDNILELRFKNGRRIYYCIIPESNVLLLIGGNKNGQTKDINQAERISREWLEN